MTNDVPLISQLIRAIIVEDYATAIEVITDEKFNPNETNESWHAPVLTAIINIATTTEKFNDVESLKEVLKEIVKHKDYDPNIVDYEGETVLMHIARHPSFNWIVPLIISTNKVDTKIKNFMHYTALDIAERYDNPVMVDILLSLNTDYSKGQPVKIKGLKKVKSIKVSSDANSNILKKIDWAFEEKQKVNPLSLFNLLTSFFKGEYDTCIQIVRDVNFNPNECDKYGEPLLSSLMYYSQDSKAVYDEDMFKKIVDCIISNRKFDVNTINADCNTVLMVAMGFPKLKWLAEKLYNIQSARLDIINDCGETIRDIANNCGNGDFYNHLVRKSFEMAEVVD